MTNHLIADVWVNRNNFDAVGAEMAVHSWSNGVHFP